MGFQVVQASHRSQIVKGTESLNRATESIARSKQVAAESGQSRLVVRVMLADPSINGVLCLYTEAIGTETLEDLVGQREQLLRAGETVHETDEEVSKAKRILISMGKRYAFIVLSI